MAPLHLRWFKWKHTMKDIEEFTDWKDRNDIALSDSWRSYHSIVITDRVISFHEFCENFYYGELYDVSPESYKNSLL